MVIKTGSMVRVRPDNLDFPGRTGLVTDVPYAHGNILDVRLAGDDVNGEMSFARQELEEVVIPEEGNERDLGIAIGYGRAIIKLEAERNRQRKLYDDLMKVAMGARAAANVAKGWQELNWAERTSTLLADDAERAARIHLGRCEGISEATGTLRLLRDELVEAFNEDQGREYAEAFADDNVPF